LASESIVVAGTIESFGGNAREGTTVTGGAGGDLSMSAGSDVALGGTVLLRGGAATSRAADAQGGAGAALIVESDGAVRIAGVIDARGGLATATATGGSVAAGIAGAVRIGETAPPTEIALLLPIIASGGDGDAAAGKGGSVIPEPDTGGVVVAGPRAIDVSGGNSLVAPGAGGLVTGGPRRDPGSGGLRVSGEIIASGGSVAAGGAGNGADGGRVDFELLPTDGALIVEPTGRITVEGGNSRAAGVAGGGGHVWLFTKDGDLTMAGTVSTHGGEALDPGGIGGLGGMVYFFTDNNHNATQNNKGNLLIAPTGVIDASGGNGTVGGNARSDRQPGSWPVFPDDQENIAIFLNCDGAHGETLNWMDNQGHLVARGGVHNGSGGDIVYHGIGPGQYDMEAPDGNHHPPSGNVDMSSDGSGQAGDYGGE
jgi:hypothetical protein